VLLRTDKPCWLYQAVLACCTNPVHTTGTTPASRQLPLSTASCTTCYGTSAYLFQCVSSVVHIYQLVLGCVDMVHKPFACSSDHNYQTTSRQLQATELFKLSRLVVVCLRFLWCQVGQAAIAGCTWLCVRLARTLCMWQQPEQLANSCNCTVRAAQHASNHLCASPGVYVWSSRTCMLHLTVLTCCTNPVHATGALHYACRKA
jgi:hypothetical protein